MAAYDLFTLSGGKQKRLPSAGATVDFLSIRVGASNLEISENGGHFAFGTKKLTGVADGAAASDAATFGQLSDGLDLKQDLSEKGQANGYASLDGGGKVPVAQLPSAVMTYEGVWDGSTNTPTLEDGTGDAGMVYRVGVAGTQDFGSGNITFAVGDYVIYNGTVWEKSDTTDAVASVNGQTGVVVLVTDDIAEDGSPTNLWFTSARAKTATIQTGSITNGVTDFAPTHDAVYDALALKADLVHTHEIADINGLQDALDGKADASHTHVAADITDFDTAAQAATIQTGAITDGVTNKAPTHDAVFDALALKADAAAVVLNYDQSGTWDNKEGATITARQVVYQTAAGEITLAQANDSLAPNSIFRMVKSASVADDANTGEYWKRGARVPGFTGLTVGSPIYLSRTSAGGYQQNLSGFVAGEHVIQLGRVLSTTEIEFDPQYLWEH